MRGEWTHGGRDRRESEPLPPLREDAIYLAEIVWSVTIALAPDGQEVAAVAATTVDGKHAVFALAPDLAVKLAWALTGHGDCSARHAAPPVKPGVAHVSPRPARSSLG
jgi:hypothetical protein